MGALPKRRISSGRRGRRRSQDNLTKKIVKHQPTLLHQTGLIAKIKHLLVKPAVKTA